MLRLAKITAFVLSLNLVVSGFSAVFAAGRAEPTILEKKCVSCHEVDIIRDHRRTVHEWKKIVSRMAGHAGGELTKVDQLMVLKYLEQHLAVKVAE